MSLVDELARLEEMRARGTLSEEEFQRAKARLIGERGAPPGVRLSAVPAPELADEGLAVAVAALPQQQPAQALAAGGPAGGPDDLRIVARRQHDLRHHGLTRQGARFAGDAAIRHARHAEQDRLDLHGHELLAADVDHLADTPQDAERTVRPLLDFIASAEPTVIREAFVARVQIARDLGAAPEPEFVVDDLPLELRVFEAQIGLVGDLAAVTLAGEASR